MTASGGIRGSVPGALKALSPPCGQPLQASDPCPQLVGLRHNQARPGQNNGPSLIITFPRNVLRHKIQASTQSCHSVLPGAGPPTQSDKRTKFVGCWKHRVCKYCKIKRYLGLLFYRNLFIFPSTKIASPVAFAFVLSPLSIPLETLPPAFCGAHLSAPSPPPRPPPPLLLVRA